MVKIFSEELHQRLMNVAMNVRKDVDGIMIVISCIYVLFLFLLEFWWSVGKEMMSVYAQQWLITYPGVPLSESFTMNWFLFMNDITGGFVVLSAIFILIYIILMACSEKREKPEMFKNTPKKNSTQTGKTCPHCNSKFIRKAGKNHPGQMYCKSCKRYF